MSTTWRVDHGHRISATRSEEHDEPRLRLVHHPRLVRIGDRAPCPADTWVAIGRSTPELTSARAGGAVRAALDDATLGREQLRVRWEPARHAFTLVPGAGARRPMAVLRPAPGASPAPLEGTVEVGPGAVVLLGDRVALGLELGRSRTGGGDRLGLVGDSDAMWQLRDDVRAAASSSRPALVQGPAGCDLEAVARAVHRHGRRAGGPFVAVSCAADGVEATLFGERGRSVATPAALAADGGTLFLDDVGALPRPAQARLLRLLDERRVLEAGGGDRPVDVRVVAGAGGELAAEVAAGRLREDLYHRLAAHVLRVPALAERPFDVPVVLVHLLARVVAAHPSLGWLNAPEPGGRPGLPMAFVLALLGHPWPGDVRELEDVVERTARLNLTPGRFRAPEELGPLPLVRGNGSSGALAVPGVDGEVRPVASLLDDPRVEQVADLLALSPRTVAKLVDRERLEALAAALADEPGAESRARQATAAVADALYTLLERHGFNQSRVAAVLGASRTTVVKLMHDLGLQRAADLDPAAIEDACAREGGDLDAAARRLRVSRHALKKRRALLAHGPGH